MVTTEKRALRMSPLVFYVGIIVIMAGLLFMTGTLYRCVRKLEEVTSNLIGETNTLHRTNTITTQALEDVNRATAEMMSQELASAGFPCTMLPDGSGYISENFDANMTGGGVTGWFTSAGFVPDETVTEEFQAVDPVTPVTDCYCRGMVPHDVRDHARAEFQ